MQVTTTGSSRETAMTKRPLMHYGIAWFVATCLATWALVAAGTSA
jgi:hypothetical protein